jgi:hypothetical protein
LIVERLILESDATSYNKRKRKGTTINIAIDQARAVDKIDGRTYQQLEAERKIEWPGRIPAWTRWAGFGTLEFGL